MTQRHVGLALVAVSVATLIGIEVGWYRHEAEQRHTSDRVDWDVDGQRAFTVGGILEVHDPSRGIYLRLWRDSQGVVHVSREEQPLDMKARACEVARATLGDLAVLPPECRP
jgi:hypothetical protein